MTSLETAAQTAGEAPLDVLVATTEEDVRRLAERLSQRGVLAGDPESSALLVEIRARLLVAAARLRMLG
jgi:hypothetical protein